MLHEPGSIVFVQEADYRFRICPTCSRRTWRKCELKQNETPEERNTRWTAQLLFVAKHRYRRFDTCRRGHWTQWYRVLMHRQLVAYQTEGERLWFHSVSGGLFCLPSDLRIVWNTGRRDPVHHIPKIEALLKTTRPAEVNLHHNELGVESDQPQQEHHYLWIALDLGPLVSCISHAWCHTMWNHHITLGYFPELMEGDIELIVGRLQDIIEKWILFRNRRLERPRECMFLRKVRSPVWNQITQVWDGTQHDIVDALDIFNLPPRPYKNFAEEASFVTPINHPPDEIADMSAAEIFEQDC